MALEIRELVIRSTVAPESGANSGASGGGGSADGGGLVNNAALLNQIVEKVMDILRTKAER
jgi:Family of unknown function (DUF5908)